MRRVQIQGTDLEVSRLSFGTASLHHLLTQKLRQNLLEKAAECGMTHFDTAPYYGSGISELELGKFLKGRRSAFTIATKVGLYPRGSYSPTTTSVLAHKFAGKLLPSLTAPRIDWTLHAAKKSLDLSLKRLKADYIDLLLLHEPAYELIQSDIFLDWLRREKANGRIRAWGLAGPATRISPWLIQNHPLAMVAQVRDSIDLHEASKLGDHGRKPQLTYGYLSSIAQPKTSKTVSDVIRNAMELNRDGSILVSTRRIDRIRELAESAVET